MTNLHRVDYFSNSSIEKYLGVQAEKIQSSSYLLSFLFSHCTCSDFLRISVPCLPPFLNASVSPFLIQSTFCKPIPWLLNAKERNHTAVDKASLSCASSAFPSTSGSLCLVRSPGFLFCETRVTSSTLIRFTFRCTYSDQFLSPSLLL